MKRLEDPYGNEITYLGLGPEAGPLPAFFYFSLSGEESLGLEPYNSPAVLSEEPSLRVFSMTIPGHGEGFDKHHAIQYWSDEMEKGNYLLENFFKETSFSLHWLIEKGMVDPHHIAVGGLSRGGFIATHLAALDTRIKIILGFAPLARLEETKEFASEKHSTHAKMRAESLSLNHLVDKLTHVHHLRFYIGNRDERVGTDACYHFIRKLADKAHDVRARHMHIELNITPSIGHKGHGTAPHTFEEGVKWMKERLLT